MHKQRIAVLFGGCSEEHDVSVKSAMEIAAHIDTDKYEPLYIGITKAGAWKICEKPCAAWERNPGGGDNHGAGDDIHRMAVILPDQTVRGLMCWGMRRGVNIDKRPIDKLSIDKLPIDRLPIDRLPIDAVFPVLHGKTGEDGTIQGLLALSGIPYVGCDVQSSVICMDKSLAYKVVSDAGIAVPAFMVLHLNKIGDTGVTSQVIAQTVSQTVKQLGGFPVFVKPARSGSSFGVTKVNSADELAAAIKTAGQYDTKILIERAVSGMEIGCAVLGNGDDICTGALDQITLSHGIFRIHQEARPEEGSENAIFTVPADIPSQTYARVQETAKAIYKALGCSGLARVDMFLQEDGRVVLNEVNTMPGFTSYSRYPRMMAAAGVSLRELIDRLIKLAIEANGSKSDRK